MVLTVCKRGNVYSRWSRGIIGAMLLWMLCVVVIGFSFPKESLSSQCIEQHQQHMNRITQLYEVVNSDKGSLCVKMNELYRVVQQGAEFLRNCPEADPTGEQRKTWADWLRSMASQKDSFC